jgi:type IV secretory pathway VirB4 component
LKPLDGPTTLDWSGSPLAIDLSGVAEDHLPFHLTYLLDALYTRLKSRPGPKLIVVDEAHLLARHPATAEFLDRMVRHVRHFDAGLLLLSQNPDDFLTSESGRSLLRNLRATVLLRLPEVSPAVRAFFSLTSAESEWLPRARLPREAGYSEALLRLGEDHLPIALVASTPEYEYLIGLLAARRPSETPHSPAAECS